VVFHLLDALPGYADALQGFAYVQSVQTMDNKIIVQLDDPEAHNPELVRTLVRAGAEIQFVGELRRRLEDVYLQLVNA
jgi:ABC-2 type transport system ATP-binding protein